MSGFSPNLKGVTAMVDGDELELMVLAAKGDRSIRRAAQRLIKRRAKVEQRKRGQHGKK
jgi:hypothetical protein